jgi:hypothetical protein
VAIVAASTAARAEDLGNGDNVLLHRGLRDFRAHNGGLFLGAGAAAGLTSDGRRSASPSLMLRLNGFDLDDGYLLDVDMGGRLSLKATVSNFADEPSFAGGGHLQASMGRIFSPGEGCSGVMGFGLDVSGQATGIPRAAGRGGSSSASRASIFRLQPGMICMDGTNTVILTPYAGLGMGMIGQKDGMTADLGAIVRTFLDDDLYLVLDGSYAHALEKSGSPRASGRAAIDVRVAGPIYLSTDVRVSHRLDAGKPGADASSPATVVAAGLTASGAF